MIECSAEIRVNEELLRERVRDLPGLVSQLLEDYGDLTRVPTSELVRALIFDPPSNGEWEDYGIEIWFDFVEEEILSEVG